MMLYRIREIRRFHILRDERESKYVRVVRNLAFKIRGLVASMGYFLHSDHAGCSFRLRPLASKYSNMAATSRSPLLWAARVETPIRQSRRAVGAPAPSANSFAHTKISAGTCGGSCLR